MQEVRDVEHRLAEKLVAALFLDLQQPALDRTDAGGADIAVFRSELIARIADELQHGAQIFQIQQQHAAIVRNLEHQLQHTLLRII